jgi:hypothetical protein
MSKLQTALDEYLKLRRALGHKLLLSGRLLQRFVEFADRVGADVIATELATNWAMQPAEAQPAQWANRLGMVRRFAQYCSAIDPRTTVPPLDLLPHRYRRPTPSRRANHKLAPGRPTIAVCDGSAASHLFHALWFVCSHRHAMQRTVTAHPR